MGDGDVGHVDRVVEVGVADEDRVGGGDEPVDEIGLDGHRALAEHAGEGETGQEGVDEHGRALVGQPESGGTEPLDLEAGGEVDAVPVPVEVLLDAGVVAMAKGEAVQDRHAPTMIRVLRPGQAADGPRRYRDPERPGGETADAGGLNPPAPTGACGFNSHPGHQEALQ